MRVKLKREKDEYLVDVGSFLFKRTYRLGWHLSRELTGAITSYQNEGIFSSGQVPFLMSSGSRGSFILHFDEFDWVGSSIYEVSAELKNRLSRVREAINAHSTELEFLV